MSNSRNELVDVVARAKRRFPDHRLDGDAFPVCLPVYELRIKVTEVAEDDLSTPARFALQLSNLNITQPTEIGRLLGLSDTYVAGAATELLNGNLVVQWPDRGIRITDYGKQVLGAGGKTRRPRNRHIKVPYDPLTKRIIDVDIGLLLDRDFVRKNGLFVAPTNPRRPRLSNLRIDEVKDYDRSYRGRHDKTEILEVSDIKDVKLRYIDDVILVKLDAPNTNKPKFAAYRAQQYLEEESVSIQRLADRGVDLEPEELKASQATYLPNPISVSREESVLLEDIDGLDHKVSEAERAVVEARATQGTTQDVQERADLAARIEKLESEKLDSESKLTELESELNTLTQGQTRLVKTEEHRPLLFQAITKASSELTLVSAWIDPFAFDDELCRMLAAAIGRGTKVRIAWGLGVNSKRGSEATRIREKGNNALATLKKLIPGNLKDNLEIKITETHEKFIICDRLFCAWGSFNWLSYRGERDSGYRRETSFYSERQDDIAHWKGNAEVLFRAY